MKKIETLPSKPVKSGEKLVFTNLSSSALCLSELLNPGTVNSKSVNSVTVDKESGLPELINSDSGHKEIQILPRASPEDELMASANSGPLEVFKPGVPLSASRSAAVAPLSAPPFSQLSAAAMPPSSTLLYFTLLY